MSFSAFENWQTQREQIGLKTDHILLGYSSENLLSTIPDLIPILRCFALGEFRLRTDIQNPDKPSIIQILDGCQSIFGTRIVNISIRMIDLKPNYPV